MAAKKLRKADKRTTYRKLRGSEITKTGDKPMYVDGNLGRSIGKHERGMKAGSIGYYAVVRKRK